MPYTTATVAGEREQLSSLTGPAPAGTAGKITSETLTNDAKTIHAGLVES